MTNEMFKLLTSVTLGSFRHWKREDGAGRLATQILNNQQIHQSFWGGVVSNEMCCD